MDIRKNERHNNRNQEQPFFAILSTLCQVDEQIGIYKQQSIECDAGSAE